ncbi:hypothetical protein ANTPLA_LOCUS4853 [Anthophora plagiata]
MLKSLPSNYSHIGDLVDVLPEKDRNVDYLKSKIKLKIIEEKNEKSEEVANNKSNAFKAKTSVSPLSPSQSNVCFHCRKSGHIKRDCWYANRSRGRGHTLSTTCGRETSNFKNSQGGRSNYK